MKRNLKKGVWKEVIIIFTIFLFGMFFYFNEGLLDISFTGFATINVTTEGDFNNGTYTNAHYNTSNNSVRLNGTLQVGNYTSKVFDATESVNWTNISWISNGVGELPDDAVVEVGPNAINMTGNVVLYHFNNNTDLGETNTSFNDTSGNSNTAICVAENCSQVNTTGWLLGGLTFDNTDDYLSIESPTGLPSGNVAKTVAAWYTKSATCGDGSKALGGFGNSDTGENFQIDVCGSGNSMNILGWGGGEDWDTGLEGTPFADNAWHHVAVTYDGNLTTLYIDGGINKTNTTAYDWNTATTRIVVGNEIDKAGMHFDGTIDEFGIWDRSLSADEVSDLYERGLMRLNLSVRSCNDSACDGEALTDVNDTTVENLSVTNNRYFQYEYQFYSNHTNRTPYLFNVSLGYRDITVPDLNFSSVVNGSANSVINVSINWTYYDLSNINNCFYELNYAANVAISDCTLNYTNITGVEGATNNITVYLNDSDGNIGSDGVWTFLTDTVAPTEPTVENILFSNAVYANGSYFNASQLNLTFNWTNSDEVNFGNYTLMISDNSSFGWYNQSYNQTDKNDSNYTLATPLPNGTWYWIVNASDQTGRTNTTVDINRFVVDTILPTEALPLTPTNESRTNDNTTTINWTTSTDVAVDNYTIDFSTLNDFSTINHTFNHTRQNESNLTLDFELPQDPDVDNITYYWRVKAHDKAGNVNVSSTFVLFIDGKLPGVSEEGPTGIVSDTTPTLTVTTNENATCKYNLGEDVTYGSMGFTFDGAESRSHTRVHEVLSEGAYTVYVRCKDIANNLNSESFSYEFTIETSSAGGGGAGGGGSAAPSVVPVVEPSDVSESPEVSEGPVVVESGESVNVGSVVPSVTPLYKAVQVAPGGKVEFKLEVEEVFEDHSMEILEATEEKVTLLISSEPQEVTVLKYETVEVDLDGDLVSDLLIAYNGLIDGRADISFSSVKEVVEEEEDSLWWIWIIFGGVLFLGLVVFVYEMKKT